jgi:ligand-binding sensor domain-containing protein
MKRLFFSFLFTFLLVSPAFSAFQLVTGIDDSDIKDIAISPFYPDLIYVASSNSLYKSKDKGKTYQEIYSFVDEEIRQIFFSQKVTNLFYIVCSDNFYRLTDKREKLFSGDDEERILSAAEGNGFLYLGTTKGLYVSNQDFIRWREISGIGKASVYSIESGDDYTYVAASSGVYVLSSDNKVKRTFVLRGIEEEDEEDAAGLIPNRIKIDIFDKEKIWLATSRGLFVSENGGKDFQKFFTAGIDYLNILDLTQTDLEKNNLYLAADKGFFKIDTKAKKAKALFEGLPVSTINQVEFSKKGKIYLATAKGLFTNQHFTLPSEDRGLRKFLAKQPSIRYVHQNAISANEVSAEKITRWRQAAMKRAWLPELKVGVDKGIDEQYHWAGTAVPNYRLVAQGPDQKDFGWDITATWDLGDLVWNSSQTSIDTRSRLNTKLRIDILEEVNRVYFERLRFIMQLEKESLPEAEALEKELRTRELTAILDYYTGGAFSKRLKELNKK